MRKLAFAVLAVALTPRHQRLGDLVAGTLVLRDRRYDLSRYAPPAVVRQPLPPGRAVLSHRDYEWLAEFLHRRGELTADARARIGAKIAAALAARAGVASPAASEVEPFLEAFAAQAAGGRSG